MSFVLRADGEAGGSLRRTSTFLVPLVWSAIGAVGAAVVAFMFIGIALRVAASTFPTSIRTCRILFYGFVKEGMGQYAWFTGSMKKSANTSVSLTESAGAASAGYLRR